MLGWQYHQSFGLRTVRTRAFNHEGPRRGEVFVTSNFAKQIALIEAGKQPPVLEVGNLEARRDWHDVRDTVKAYWQAAFEGEPGEVYNIGRGEALSIQEMLDILLSMAKVDVEVRPVPERMRPVRRRAAALRPDEVPGPHRLGADDPARPDAPGHAGVLAREGVLTDENVLDVALDVTPLIGARSGVGHFVAEILDAMQARAGIRLIPYALSFRARGRAASRGCPGPPPARRRCPRAPASCPSRPPPPSPPGAGIDQPSAERWLAPATVVHGTNFVVPPVRGAAPVVTVHDLTFARYPEMVHRRRPPDGAGAAAGRRAGRLGPHAVAVRGRRGQGDPGDGPGRGRPPRRPPDRPAAHAARRPGRRQPVHPGHGDARAPQEHPPPGGRLRAGGRRPPRPAAAAGRRRRAGQAGGAGRPGGAPAGDPEAGARRRLRRRAAPGDAAVPGQRVRLPVALRGLRLPGPRGHGRRHAGGGRQRRGHPRGGRRRRPAGRPDRRRRHRRGPHPGARRPRPGREPGPGRPPPGRRLLVAAGPPKA